LSYIHATRLESAAGAAAVEEISNSSLAEGMKGMADSIKELASISAHSTTSIKKKALVKVVYGDAEEMTEQAQAAFTRLTQLRVPPIMSARVHAGFPVPFSDLTLEAMDSFRKASTDTKDKHFIAYYNDNSISTADDLNMDELEFRRCFGLWLVILELRCDPDGKGAARAELWNKTFNVILELGTLWSVSNVSDDRPYDSSSASTGTTSSRSVTPGRRLTHSC
jgi:hypothetical protein